MYKQEPPFAMQIELVEGCNLRCKFCGLNGIRGVNNNFKFMGLPLARKIVSEIAASGWNPRIEFAMHGEPSVNPNMITILKTFRKGLPKSYMMMTSNGAGFLKSSTKMIDLSLKYLNVLALDNYENVSIVPKILKTYKGIFNPLHYPSNRGANPHTRRLPNQHLLVIVQDISKASQGTHSLINNHAGCGAPKNDSGEGKRCAKPFRELSIRWDGNIAICCNDWRGTYKCGNIMEESLEDIWNNPAMTAARKRLYRGKRDFGPCDGCDAISYRTGLLPDKMGKETMPKFNARDAEAMDDAMRGDSYTEPVYREWE